MNQAGSKAVLLVEKRDELLLRLLLWNWMCLPILSLRRLPTNGNRYPIAAKYQTPIPNTNSKCQIPITTINKDYHCKKIGPLFLCKHPYTY